MAVNSDDGRAGNCDLIMKAGSQRNSVPSAILRLKTGTPSGTSVVHRREPSQPRSPRGRIRAGHVGVPEARGPP